MFILLDKIYFLVKYGLIAAFLFFSLLGIAQEKEDRSALPLEAGRSIDLKTTEGTWLSLDVSPDGKQLVFSMLGDLYLLPVTGGQAKQLTSGLAMDCQPKFSPDGGSIAFISDKSGAENAWLLTLETDSLIQLTSSTDEYYEGLSWTRDGQYLIVAKGVGLPKLHLIHRSGGTGMPLMPEPADLKAIEPTVSVNDSLVWFSRRKGMWSYNAQLPQYQLYTYDRYTGAVEAKTSRYGSAFSPTLSPDGNWLVYGTRYDEHTALILRNLKSGEEEVFAHPVERDEQESLASLGCLPTMAFTPDSRSLLAAYRGKIHAISLESREAKEIPFEIDAQVPIGPQLAFRYPIKDDAQFDASQIRDLTVSPDGKRAVFTVADRLYIMDYPNGKASRLTSLDLVEAQPAWSPDGQELVFVTWDDQQGALYKLSFNASGKLTKLAGDSGFYQEPVWSPDGTKIVFISGSAFSNQQGSSNRTAAREWLSWIPAAGGSIRNIAKAAVGGYPHFGKDADRIFLFHAAKGLLSVNWEGIDVKEHIKLSGIRTYAFSNDHGGEFEFFRSHATPSFIKKSPQGNRIFAKIANELYVTDIPQVGGKTPLIEVEHPERAAFPVQKITTIGCEFPSWSADGSKIYGALGSVMMTYELDETLTDSAKLTEKRVSVPLRRAKVEGEILLKNARLITMNGDEVIEKGDILIENNRIVNVGATGSLSVRDGTKIVDLSGMTVTPGFIDLHDHASLPLPIHAKQPNALALTLAYGVTTVRNPQPHFTDILTYRDKVRTGQTLGPRIYTTGPGVGYWAYDVKSLDHARNILKQYAQYFDTNTLKMYAVGNRKQRQWIIMAAKELSLMPTTEGNLDMKLGITEVLDGYPAHEHAHPLTDLYHDFLSLAGGSRIAYTPTLLIGYGGPSAENYFYTHEQVINNEKLKRFTPREEFQRKVRRRNIWTLDEEYMFPKQAKAAGELAEYGALLGVGAHSQLQGLGYHWEMWAMASGMSVFDVLKAATIQGAKALGLDGDLGSIEKGKLADLVILKQNPLDDIKHTDAIQYVMKDGVLYLGDTLEKLKLE